ncbi:MAG: regulatory protein RecX [Pseudohongiellaceae bacterium]
MAQQPRDESDAEPKLSFLEQKQAARCAGMDFLARREHSRHELFLKLGRKFPAFEPDAINETLDQLIADKLLSNERFTTSYINSRKNKCYGYLYIRQALRDRRVPETLIDLHLFPDDEAWMQILSSFVDRKIDRKVDRTSDTEPNSGPRLEFAGKAHRRLVRLLQSRGFTPAEIGRALKPWLGQT